MTEKVTQFVMAVNSVLNKKELLFYFSKIKFERCRKLKTIK
jgi:hypothetical protein